VRKDPLCKDEPAHFGGTPPRKPIFSAHHRGAWAAAAAVTTHGGQVWVRYDPASKTFRHAAHPFALVGERVCVGKERLFVGCCGLLRQRVLCIPSIGKKHNVWLV
jgi:hypothetical protein